MSWLLCTTLRRQFCVVLLTRHDPRKRAHYSSPYYLSRPIILICIYRQVTRAGIYLNYDVCVVYNNKYYARTRIILIITIIVDILYTQSYSMYFAAVMKTSHIIGIVLYVIHHEMCLCCVSAGYYNIMCEATAPGNQGRLAYVAVLLYIIL